MIVFIIFFKSQKISRKFQKIPKKSVNLYKNFRTKSANRSEETVLNPESVAETYWHLYTQNPTAWTFELEVRPSVEKW